MAEWCCCSELGWVVPAGRPNHIGNCGPCDKFGVEHCCWTKTHLHVCWICDTAQHPTCHRGWQLNEGEQHVCPLPLPVPTKHTRAYMTWQGFAWFMSRNKSVSIAVETLSTNMHPHPCHCIHGPVLSALCKTGAVGRNTNELERQSIGKGARVEPFLCPVCVSNHARVTCKQHAVLCCAPTGDCRHL